MKRRFLRNWFLLRICMLCVMTMIFFTSTTATNEFLIKKENAKERPFSISTSGTTCPFRFIHGKGWLFFLQMLQPWPDQTYFSLFGIINYENGTTTIINKNTGETVQKEGAHKVIIYHFLGPIANTNGYLVSIEGNVSFACVL